MKSVFLNCGVVFQAKLQQIDRQQREMLRQVKIDVEDLERHRQQLVELFRAVSLVSLSFTNKFQYPVLKYHGLERVSIFAPHATSKN